MSKSDDLISRQAAIDAVSKALDRQTLLYGFVRKVALDAIENLPSAQPETHEKRTETHSCDCMERQAAIKYFTELWECIETIGNREEWEDVCATTANEIKSAQPDLSGYSDKLWKAAYERGKAEALAQRKTGKWIKHIDDLFPAESTIECPMCHHEQPLTIDDSFCPNCGADMRGEQE